MKEREQYIPRQCNSAITSYIIDNPRANIWSKMGTGKTASALTALDIMYSVGCYPHKTLVIAPARVAANTWPAECEKWAHLKDLKMVTLTGGPAERIKALRSDFQIATINYENIPWLIQTCANDWPFRFVIADESVKLKNFRITQGGIRARALGLVAHKQVDRWVNLTGAPAPNGYADLWGQNWFIDCGRRLGKSYEAYKERFFCYATDPNINKHAKLVPVEHGTEIIQHLLQDVTITIESKDHFNLPEQFNNVIKIPLPKAILKQYKQLERDFFVKIEGQEIAAFSAAAKSIKCLQAAAGAIYLQPGSKEWAWLHDAKIDALRDVIEEANGAPVMVSYWWDSDLERLKKAFPQGRELDRKRTTEDAWNRGDIPILFVQPQSAGHGLNLQYGGNIIAFFSLWWDLDPYTQVIERIGPVRQAQAKLDRPVYVHHLVAERTLDEAVYARLQSKDRVQSVLMRYMADATSNG